MIQMTKVKQNLAHFSTSNMLRILMVNVIIRYALIIQTYHILPFEVEGVLSDLNASK